VGGLAIYGTGSLITAVSPNIQTLYFGWSLIEGLGAALVIPAIAALVVSTYQGADRAIAYGMLGGVAAAGIAVGPVIGGFVTTYLSWRYVFVAESVLVIVVIFMRGRLVAPPQSARAPRLDIVGTLASATGLILIVYGILQSSAWGWVRPNGAATIGGREVTPFGFSVVPFLIAAGLVVLGLFQAWEERQLRNGQDVLLDVRMLRVPQLRSGLMSLAAMQMCILGLFFVIPVYMQIVLGFDAFATGLRLMPLSIAMFVAAMFGPRIAKRFAPRRIVWSGLSIMLLGSLGMVDVVDPPFSMMGFSIATALFGIGAGLLASQLGNVIMSSVTHDRSSEAGGLQGTAQNLGASLGTALIGSVLLASLTTGVVTEVTTNPDLSEPVRQGVLDSASAGVPIITIDQLDQALIEAGVEDDDRAAVNASYAAAQSFGLKEAVGAVASLALLGFFMSRGLPTRPISESVPVDVNELQPT